MFKVGDKVRVKRCCSGCLPVIEYVLKHGSKRGNEMDNLFAREKFETDMSPSGCNCISNWIISINKDEMYLKNLFNNL